MLLPQPGQDYPDVSRPTDIKKSRFQINLNIVERFQGFLGSSSNPKVPQPEPGIELQQNQLNWRENFFKESENSKERTILTKEEILKNSDPKDLLGNLSELTDLTLKGFLIALTSNANPESKANSNLLSDQVEILDRRTQDPSVGQTDDETADISSKDMASPYFKGEFERDSYDHRLAQAFSPNDSEDSLEANEKDLSDGLSFGQIVAELATLIKDPQAKVNQDATNYTVAPYLNLILVFDEDVFNEENNKVEKLLDLDKASFKVWDEVKAEFQTITLEPLDDESIEYDLIPGLTFQSQTEICLTWTFKLEEDDLNNTELQPISAAYKTLDRFVVTRTILNQSNQHVFPPINPCWIEDKDQLLRPQFQFGDNRLQDSGIRENDLLQYRIEAKTLGDRVLAQCLINVVRKTIKPLQAPTQSLALHKLKNSHKINDLYQYQFNEIELKVAFWFDIPESGDVEEKKIEEIEAIKEQLQVGYRFIPASKVGFYGVEATLGVKSQWVEQSIAQKPDIKIQFAQSEQDRSMPWEEVTRLLIPDVNGELHPVKFERVFEEESNENKQIQVIYQSIIPEETFWNITKPELGMAIELFIGREITADKKTGEPLQRSPLIRCRHAIQLPAFNTQQDFSLKDFEIGNTVNAIEKLPDQLPTLSYQNPRLIKGWADYPPVDTTDTVNLVKLAIEWQHLKKQTDKYNPIAAYRLYRADAYSPTEYIRRDDKKALFVQPELTFRTIPLAMYQANPSTIEVLGRVVEKDGQQKVMTDWQAQSLKNPLWENTDPTKTVFTRLSTDTDLKYPSSPIWVLEGMAQFILEMQRILEESEPGKQQYRPVLQFHHPLEDRSPFALKNEGATVRERLDRLISNLNEMIDPLGWWTLETLGLSCECHFEDAEGKRFDAQQLIEKLRNSIQGQEQPYPFSVVLFLAEDGKTFLNVFRLIYIGDIWETETSTLKIPITLRLIGRCDPEHELELEQDHKDLDKLYEVLIKPWLDLVKNRVINSMSNKGEAGQVVVYRYVGLGSETPEQKPLASLTLPIASDGLIRHEISVPDQWAHHYTIALEHLRRYDLVWQRLIEPTEQLALNAREIPYNQLLFNRVDRTLKLVPHNVIALPCIGGIQSLVFVHPAAFAALASAVNATHGQYSGQHVFLERRINPVEEEKMLKLYPKLLDIEKWKLYQTWINKLEPLGSAKPDDSPSLLGNPSVALTEVPGTLAAIYGSDRYIYPDLPGYYEYSVSVYSTAGRVCSPIQRTPFVSPIYDQPKFPKDKRKLEDEPRQQPQTVPCRDVSFNRDNNSLILKIRLIHYRNHLRDEIKVLWRNDQDSEDKLNVGTDIEAFKIDYGSLPDLYLTYQIYLRENPEEEDFAEPVLLPLAEIVPPLQKGNNQGDSTSSFKSKTQLTGVKHVENGETIIDLTINQDSNNSGLENGELYFQLKLDFKDPACIEALKKLRNYNLEKVGELIYLSVAREGVWSEIVTTTAI